MTTLQRTDPLAREATDAIRRGDCESLRRLLREHPTLANARLAEPAADGAGAGARTLLHIVTDWPGKLPNASAMIAVLVEYGADVNARFIGANSETPLHWAASSDDVAALDALLDAGADIEAPGAVIGGGTPLADAVAFAQWNAARRLVERGARTTLWQAAALGLLDRVDECLSERSADATSATKQPDEVTHAFWCACHGGQRAAAERLLQQGADLNWVGYEGRTPLDAAAHCGAADLAEWLRSRGGVSARERDS